MAISSSVMVTKFSKLAVTLPSAPTTNVHSSAVTPHSSSALLLTPFSRSPCNSAGIFVNVDVYKSNILTVNFAQLTCDFNLRTANRIGAKGRAGKHGHKRLAHFKRVVYAKSVKLGIVKGACSEFGDIGNIIQCSCVALRCRFANIRGNGFVGNLERD